MAKYVDPVRLQMAAIFLSKWVDASEEPGPRLDKRIEKALALADRLIAASERSTPTTTEAA